MTRFLKESGDGSPIAEPELQMWQAQRNEAIQGLARCLSSGQPPEPTASPQATVASDAETRAITFRPEPGLTLVARYRPPAAPAKRLAIVLDLDGAEKAADSAFATELLHRGWNVTTMDLRATGKLATPRLCASLTTNRT